MEKEKSITRNRQGMPCLKISKYDVDAIFVCCPDGSRKKCSNLEIQNNDIVVEVSEESISIWKVKRIKELEERVVLEQINQFREKWDKTPSQNIIEIANLIRKFNDYM